MNEVQLLKQKLRREYKSALASVMRENPTHTEKLMIDLLEKYEIKFLFQCEILGYIPDFYMKKGKIILEVDGSIHKSRVEYDQHRDKVFIDAGFRILRIKSDQLISSPEKVIGEIQAFMKRSVVVVKRQKQRAKKRWQNVPKLTKDHLPSKRR